MGVDEKAVCQPWAGQVARNKLQNIASSVLLAFACCFLIFCSLANGAAAQGQIDPPTPRLLIARICLFVCYVPLCTLLASGSTCVAFVRKSIIVPVRPVCVCSSNEMK